MAALPAMGSGDGGMAAQTHPGRRLRTRVLRRRSIAPACSHVATRSLPGERRTRVNGHPGLRMPSPTRTRTDSTWEQVAVCESLLQMSRIGGVENRIQRQAAPSFNAWGSRCTTSRNSIAAASTGPTDQCARQRNLRMDKCRLERARMLQYSDGFPAMRLLPQHFAEIDPRRSGSGRPERGWGRLSHRLPHPRWHVSRSVGRPATSSPFCRRSRSSPSAAVCAPRSCCSCCPGCPSIENSCRRTWVSVKPAAAHCITFVDHKSTSRST